MKNPNCRLFICLSVVLCANVTLTVSQLQAQGRLAQVRQNVRRHETPHSKHNDEDKHPDDDENDRDHGHHRGRRRRHHNDHSGFLFLNLFDACHHPPVVEHVLVYEPVPVIFETVPSDDYQSMPQQPIVFEPAFGNWFSGWSGRLTAIYGYDFDSLTHGSLGWLAQSPGFLGLDTSVTMIRESGTTFRDHLWLGDVNVVYEAINTDDFRARMGVGINWLGDNYGGEAGANLTFGLDWKVNSNWVLTGEADFGSLGDTDLFHAQLSIGRQFDHAEWTTGYNYYDLGGAPIGGLFTGLRFRF